MCTINSADSTEFLCMRIFFLLAGFFVVYLIFVTEKLGGVLLLPKRFSQTLRGRLAASVILRIHNKRLGGISSRSEGAVGI